MISLYKRTSNPPSPTSQKCMDENSVLYIYFCTCCVFQQWVVQLTHHCWILCPLQAYFSPFTFLGLCVPQDPKIAYFSLRTLKFAYTSTNSSKFGGKPLL